MESSLSLDLAVSILGLRFEEEDICSSLQQDQRHDKRVKVGAYW